MATGHLPQNLAALGNAAVSIVRVMGRFDYLPQANRHYAARPQDALDAILTPAQPWSGPYRETHSLLNYVSLALRLRRMTASKSSGKVVASNKLLIE